MSTNPPSLLYLAIYNPTLRPIGTVSKDDEDAIEQAHILFYTSRERAVSRDRMLRQVGLAKALVNFSEMFNPEDACETVHSQSRRMVMVSPEPDFWIHAGIEVAKTSRVHPDKGTSKTKAKKAVEKGKGKETEIDPPTIYDYHDASVHDSAVREDILRGYERFKLTHGSFTSILSTLGQQALELQLERFFTVWAWSWNLEDGQELGENYGPPLHPLHRSLIPLLDQFSSQIPTEVCSIILLPPYAVPSTRFTNSHYPSSLSQHLISLIPPPPLPGLDLRDGGPSSLLEEGTLKARRPPNDILNHSGIASIDSSKGSDRPSGGNTFLGMPAMNLHMNVNMDMRKWNWPGYLTFGKGGMKRQSVDMGQVKTPSTEVKLTEALNNAGVEVDQSALEDAIASDNGSVSILDPHLSAAEIVGPRLQDDNNLLPVGVSTSDGAIPEVATDISVGSHIRAPADADASSLASSTSLPVDGELSPIPEFSISAVHLADPNNPSMTKKQKISYMTKYPLSIALVGIEVTSGYSELNSFTESFRQLLEGIETSIDQDALKSATISLPSATNILQPQDRHLILVDGFTLSSSEFSSKSEHLFNAQQLQEGDSDIVEVFSRGQNPQHWHVAKRGLGIDADGIVKEGEVYLEVERKEATLADVDNVLAGVVRRFIE